MNLHLWQAGFMGIYWLLALACFGMGVYQSVVRRNSYGYTPWFYFMGSFVWGDALIYGLFWTLTTPVVYFYSSWYLFWVLISVFWVVRGFGETIFWFNQQFSTIQRYPAQALPGYRFFKNDSIWFVYQIVAQCVTVVAIISAIFFSALWVKSWI
jgi:hypothetical protein